MIPTLDIDPFCQAFFDDPFPAHAALRDAGPVVYLPRYDIFAVARYENVQAMLLDWGSFTRRAASGCPTSRGKNPGACRACCWRPTRRCMTTRAS